ncbi:MAG: hypothetical protein ACOH5I_25875 [Oligoflexus sp.]
MSDWQAFWNWIDGGQRSDELSPKNPAAVETHGFMVLELDGIELEVPAIMSQDSA